jgi:phage major head subunit gpT-like protein
MAVVNSDFLTGLLTNFRAIFQNDFAAASATAFWPNLAMNVNSQGQIESYNWFGTAPKMRDVTHDGVTLQGLSKYNFTITNALYKAGLEVERTALEDDKLGLIMPRVRGLGPEAARHPGELILSLFEQNPTAYDSVAFFAGTHSDGDSGTIDNLGAGTGITVAQFQADLASARAAMNRFKDDRGRPMMLKPNTIVIPPELNQVAFQALNFDLGAGKVDAIPPSGEGGMWSKNGYTVIENPYLTDVTDWYALAVGSGEHEKPFVFQDRVKPQLEGITSANSESGVLLDKFVYTVRGRYAVGVADYRRAYKIVNA